MSKSIGIALGVVVLVVILGVAAVQLRGRPEESSNSLPTTQATGQTDSVTTTPASAGQSAAVTFSDSGFSPATITVSLGTTVTFTNESSRSVWVGSNPHPLHTDYAAFDSGKGIAPGETYTFTFDRAGTWSYHNHLASSQTGTIVVK